MNDIGNEEKRSNPAPASALSFLGLRIERKTDILAATAFLLALFGVVLQLLAFVRGADVTLYPPEFVILYFDTYPNGDVMVRIAATMSYVNSGEPTYGAIIRRERVEFGLKGRKFQQVWQSFQRIDRAGTSIQFKRQGDAQPTPVPGASSVSHSTVFAPRPVTCSPSDAGCDPYREFLSDADFLKAVGQVDKLEFTFYAEIVGKTRPLSVACSIRVDPGLIALIMMNRWYSAICSP